MIKTPDTLLKSHYLEAFGEDWYQFLEEYINSPEFRMIEKHEKLARSKYAVWPEKGMLLRAFRLCPLKDLKVIWMGQDPYPAANQATGLSFAISNTETYIPFSLKYIHKEFVSDVCNGRTQEKFDFTFESYAKQGVLMLNRALSVRENKPNSHLHYWKSFTDFVVEKLSDEKENLVFILLGGKAQAVTKLIDPYKHHIVKAAHPASEYYSSGKFLGSKIFSKTNQYLEDEEITMINWKMKQQ